MLMGKRRRAEQHSKEFGSYSTWWLSAATLEEVILLDGFPLWAHCCKSQKNCIYSSKKAIHCCWLGGPLLFNLKMSLFFHFHSLNALLAAITEKFSFHYIPKITRWFFSFGISGWKGVRMKRSRHSQHIMQSIYIFTVVKLSIHL